MKNILIVLTNTEKYGKLNKPTGLWLSELTHFYDVIVKNGMKADFVSPNGGYVPLDPKSLQQMDETDWKWYENEEFRNKALGSTYKPQDIDPGQYVAIYYAGGHGVMWDFCESQSLAKIAGKIYKNNGYVTAVCHGVVGLVNVKDEADGYLLKGKTITGFTNEEENMNGTNKEVPFLAEDALKERGAIFKAGAAFTEVVRVNGRLITGQNPQSAHSVGEELVKKLEN